MGRTLTQNPNTHNPKPNEECLIGKFLVITSKYMGLNIDEAYY
jgi:hypothetical protein